MSTVISKQTGAVAASASTQFAVLSNPIGVSADLLAAAEEVDIYYQAEDTAAFAVVGVTLTAAEPQQTLTLKGNYRVAKDATVGACGVFIRDSAIS